MLCEISDAVWRACACARTHSYPEMEYHRHSEVTPIVCVVFPVVWQLRRWDGGFILRYSDVCMYTRRREDVRKVRRKAKWTSEKYPPSFYLRFNEIYTDVYVCFENFKYVTIKLIIEGRMCDDDGWCMIGQFQIALRFPFSISSLIDSRSIFPRRIFNWKYFFFSLPKVSNYSSKDE